MLDVIRSISIVKLNTQMDHLGYQEPSDTPETDISYGSILPRIG